jgi:3-hydroxy-3-methylglutaryl CoA synthase
MANLSWNRLIGNSYTSSLWISFLRALSRSNENEVIACFSYGSGCGSELMLFRTQNIANFYWASEINNQLSNQIILSKEQYMAWRSMLI